MRRLDLAKLRRKRHVRRRPINVLASALTTAGLYCGIRSIFASIDQDYAAGAYFILAALVFDMVDGPVAKMTRSISEFGKQLDSLCDLVSFGAAPAVLIYTAYLHEEVASHTLVAKTGSLMAVIYVIAGALRLARYNVYQSEVRDYFVGLPIPAAAATVATFVLFARYFGWEIASWVFTPLTLGLAYLMVSTIRYPKDKMKAFVFRPRNAFRFLVLCGLGIAAFHKASQYSAAIVLFPLVALYVLYGIGEAWYYRSRRRMAAPQLPAHASTSPPEPSHVQPDTDPPNPP